MNRSDPTDQANDPPGVAPRTSNSNKTFFTEALIGVLIGLAVLAALVTSTAEIPFVYQGY